MVKIWALYSKGCKIEMVSQRYFKELLTQKRLGIQESFNATEERMEIEQLKKEICELRLLIEKYVSELELL